MFKHRSITVAASMRGPPGVKVFFADLSSKGRRRPEEAPHSMLPPSFLRKVFPLPSPTRPASIRTLLWSGMPRCQLESFLSKPVLPSQNRTESPRFPKRSFRRDLAVTRTRRLATQQNYIVLSCLLRRSRRLAVAQRLVHFPTHPQPVQQHRQLPAAGGQLQPPPLQIRIRTPPAQYTMRPLHQQLPQVHMNLLVG